MWLDDDDLFAYFASGEVEKVTTAFEATLTRWRTDELPDGMAPIRPDVLAPYERDVPATILDDYLDMTLGKMTNFPAPSSATAAQYIAQTAVLYANLSGQYVIATALRVDDNAPERVTQVLGHIGSLLPQIEGQQAHIESIGYLISCLLDGDDAVREAIGAAVAQWPTTPTHLAAQKNADSDLSV
jgi:hypothetical protein